MLPLVSYRFMLRRIFGPLPEQDLVRAHSIAPDVLVGLRSVDQQFWFSQGLQSLSASGIALTGHLLLGWSVLWILAALTIDLLATVLGDWLKLRLAPGAVVAEMSRALEAEFVLDTSRALHKVVRWTGPPGPPRHDSHPSAHARMKPGAAPLRYIYRGTDRRQDALKAARKVLVEVSSLTMMFCAFVILLLLTQKVNFEPVTLILLAFAAASRVFEAIRRARVADREPGLPHPHLLPSSVQTGAAVFFSCMLLLWIIILANIVPGMRLDSLILPATGTILLGLHLLSSAAILWLWRARVGRGIVTVHNFVETGLEPHRARWRHVNADDAMLCIPHSHHEAHRASRQL